MSDPYLAGLVWRLANMSETQWREREEVAGRLAARRSGRRRRILRALRGWRGHLGG